MKQISFVIILAVLLYVAKSAYAQWGFEIDPPTTTVTVACEDSTGNPVSGGGSLSETGDLNCDSTNAKLRFSCDDGTGVGCKQTDYTLNGSTTTILWPGAGTPTPTPISLNNTGGSPPGTHAVNNVQSKDYNDNPETPFNVNVILGLIISGQVYVDKNHNCTIDAADSDGKYTTSANPFNISVTPAQGSITRDYTAGTSPSYNISGLTSGNYTVTFTAPSGYRPSSCNDGTVTSNQVSISYTGLLTNRTQNFSITPLYSISGNVFEDMDKDGVKDAGENFYAGSIEIATSGGTLTFSSGNHFEINPLISGHYDVSYTSLPAGYELTTSSLFPVYIGEGTGSFLCDPTGNPPGTSCTNGSIANVNFGITNNLAWFQGVGGDVRFDSGISDRIPQSPITTHYALLENDNGTAGIVFYGGSASFGQGEPSRDGWIIQDIFTPANPRTIRTSYEYYQTSLTQQGLTPTSLSTVCSDYTNCTLPANLENGVYQALSSLSLNAYNFPAGNYVFLVDGDLTIKGNITVPVGSGIVFATSRDIIVDSGVGTTPSSWNSSLPTPTPNIEGLYSAGRNFNAGGTGSASCATTPDNKILTIGGAVIVNANFQGGSFTYGNRDLCGDNQNYPAVYIIERPDFYLNAPSFVKTSTSVWKEIEP